ncbi:class I SAM-dependent methyltransferase [bacterium]|nr:class I SAM-dependent methyltransferase [bacterium]
MGQSTNVLVYLLRKYGRTEPVFSCDPWEFGSDSYTEGDSILQRPGFAEFAQEAFKLNCRFFSQGQEPKTFALTSDSFFEQWREESELTDIFGRSGKLGGPISFAFVDGLHTAEAVRRDFQNVDTWLLPGGYVLLDDTGYDSPYPDCRQFAFSLLKHPGYEVIRRSPNFLFRKKK